MGCDVWERARNEQSVSQGSTEPYSPQKSVRSDKPEDVGSKPSTTANL